MTTVCRAARRLPTASALSLLLLALPLGCGGETRETHGRGSGGADSGGSPDPGSAGGVSTGGKATAHPGVGGANGGAAIGGQPSGGAASDGDRSGGASSLGTGARSGGAGPSSAGAPDAGQPGTAGESFGGQSSAGAGPATGGGADPSSGGAPDAGQPSSAGETAGGQSSAAGAAGAPGCAGGLEYLVPGCSPGGASFDAGCYQRCESAADQSCPSDRPCQSTRINPCVCDGPEACCAACAMSAWVCLPTPEDCQIDERDTVIVSARNSFGHCAGECTFELSIAITSVSMSACDDVDLAISDTPGTGLLRANSGKLTPLAHQQVRTLAEALVGVELQDTYGCPDCADGGASRITLSRLRSVSSHTYEYLNPPEELVAADSLVQALIGGLRDCETNPYLTLAPGCTPGT
jgi:hypothetical protein